MKLKKYVSDLDSKEAAAQGTVNDSLNRKFPYIVAWGRYMGSFMYYINDQCREAERTGAPANAIYQEAETGKWQTIDDCHPDSRARVETFLIKEESK